MAALRAAIYNALSGWWKHNVGIQVLWDLTTVGRQPGETAASALKPSHMYIFTASKRSCGKVMFLHLSVILFTGGFLPHISPLD